MLHSDKGHVKWEQRDATQMLSCVWAEVGLGGGVVVRWVRKNACEQRQTESAGIGSFKGQLGGNELRAKVHTYWTWTVSNNMILSFQLAYCKVISNVP